MVSSMVYQPYNNYNSMNNTFTKFLNEYLHLYKFFEFVLRCELVVSLLTDGMLKFNPIQRSVYQKKKRLREQKLNHWRSLIIISV